MVSVIIQSGSMMIHTKFGALVGALAGAATLAFATSSSAATGFDGVTLRGVQILGSTYDVTFHDGTFNAAFPTAELTFLTYADARAAVDAIRAQAGYQSLELTAPAGFGGILTPHAVTQTRVYAALGGGYNPTGGGGFYPAYNYGDQYTWASFDLSAVPEPDAWAMMIIGFGAVGSFVRASRRRNAVA